MGKKIVLEGKITNFILKQSQLEAGRSNQATAQTRYLGLPSQEYHCGFEINGQTVTSIYIDTRPFRNQHLVVIVGEVSNEGTFYVEAFHNLTTDFFYDPRALAISGTGAIWGICLVTLPFLIWQIAAGSLDSFTLVIWWSLLVFLGIVSVSLAWSYLSARKATKILVAYLKSRA